MASSNTGSIEVLEGNIAYTYHPPASQATQPRPPLIFLHSGVSDQHLWDSEASYFSHRDYPCLTYDLLGFGLSNINTSVLDQWKAQSQPQTDSSEDKGVIDHLRCLNLIITQVLPSLTQSHTQKPVLVGLSMGAGLALEHTINHPDQTSGTVLVAGGIRGANWFMDNAEAKLWALDEELTTKGEVEALAQLQIRLWGDGPRATEGRFKGDREKMLCWNRGIAKREVEKTGGTNIPFTQGKKSPPMQYLADVKVPMLVAWGEEDVKCVTAAMKELVEKVEGAEGKGWDAAHMVNLEYGEEFDRWMEEWLERKFGK